VVLKRAAWMAVLMAVLALAVPVRAAEPAAGQAKKELAPDELPTHLIKVLRTTNKAQTNRYVPKVYDVQNVNPYALLRWIRRTAQIEDGAFFFFGKPDKDGNVNSGKIVVTLPDYMLPGFDEMMKVIDTPGMTSTGGDLWFYFRPKYRNVTDAGFVNLIQSIRGLSTDAVPDPEVNKLLVYTTTSKLDDVKRWLPEIDVPPPQVMVEVTVYEVAVDNGSKLGLDYVNWKNGPGRNLFAAGLFGEKEKVHSLDNASPLLDTGTGGTYGLPGHEFSTSGANFAWFLDVPSAFFDFLVVKGKARVMTSAKIAARNLIPASLSVGDTILYYQTLNGPAPTAGTRPEGLPLDPTNTSTTYPDNRAVVGTSATRTTTLGGVKSGVSLAVTPTIGEKEMDLVVVTTVVSHTGFDSNGVPVCVSRTANTDIRARDGQEIVLGGMTRESFVQRADKIPILGSLPILGYLFGGEGNTQQRSQVVIVLTPYVIRDFSAMSYPGTKIDAALIQSKATRKEPAPVPQTEAGFDQWLLDGER